MLTSDRPTTRLSMTYATVTGPGYISRNIRKWRTDRFGENGSYDSCISCKRLVPSHLHALHMSKLPFQYIIDPFSIFEFFLLMSPESKLVLAVMAVAVAGVSLTTCWLLSDITLLVGTWARWRGGRVGRPGWRAPAAPSIRPAAAAIGGASVARAGGGVLVPLGRTLTHHRPSPVMGPARAHTAWTANGPT